MKSSFFETIKSVDGELFNIEYHQRRYESVLNSFGVKDTKNLSEYIKPPKIGIFRCRLVYDMNDITIFYHEYKKRDISSLKLIFNNEIDYSKKSTAREELESLYALREECDDILIVKDLFVTDTSIANIAFYSNGLWITPRNPLLKGTTRARLLDDGRIVEADIKVHELRKFSKVALLNAMIDFDILQECEFLI